jgi:hypothetical protein
MFRGKMKGADVREVMGMRSRVKSEVDLYLEMRKAVMAQDGRDGMYVAATLLLLVASAAIMATWYEALILWVIVTFILYSFNYVVFFLPITRHPGERRAKERGDATKFSIKGPLRYLLKKRRKFAIEVGVTMFLAGMVPLARSFFVLFGAGLVFTLYHGIFLEELPVQLTILLIVQILVIMGYFVVVVAVSPQSQGFTRIAESIKQRMISARSRGRTAYTWSIVLSGALAIAVSLMAVGAILLPGRTLDSLIEFLHVDGTVHIVALAAIMVAEFFIMRVLQSRGSRHMALTLIDRKIEALESFCLAPLDALIETAETHGGAMIERGRLDEILYDYYPISIYDVVETNIFGHLPVFLVVPDVHLMLDEDVLRYVGGPRDLGSGPMIEDRQDVDVR